MQGLDEMQRKLKQLPKDVATVGVRDSLLVSADLFVEDAAARVVVRRGDLRRSIRRFTTRHDKRNGFVRVWAGPDYKRGGNAAHLVEFGHRIVGPKPNKTDTGKRARAFPFMRPAWDAKRMAALRAVRADLSRFIISRAGRT